MIMLTVNIHLQVHIHAIRVLCIAVISKQVPPEVEDILSILLHDFIPEVPKKYNNYGTKISQYF